MAAWPSLPLALNVRRRTIYATDVFTAAGGNEVRRQTWSAPRYEYTLTYNGLRPEKTVTAVGQPYNGYTEPAALAYMFTAAAGAQGTHTFTDPVDGVSRTVRFVEDSLEVERVIGGWWRVSLKLITVL